MTRKQKQNTKIPFLIIGGVLVVAAVVFCVLNFMNRPKQTDTVVSEETTVATKIKTTSTGEKEEVVIEKEKVVQYEGEDPNTAETLFGTITYASVSNDKLVLRVSIDQFLSSGTCELSIKQNDKTIYTESANIFSDATASTCEGFDVPVSKLGSGNFAIEIKLKTNDKNGIIKGEVEI